MERRCCSRDGLTATYPNGELQMLKADSISKSYNGNTVLDGVSLAVEPGTACVVIGPSGAGKSTLLRCIGLLEESDAGTVVVDDKTYKLSADHGQNGTPWPELTLVFQQHFLWPHLTLMDNITLPLRHRMSESEIRGTLNELVELFDMADFVRRYPNEASLGQRQRVALARAFALRPKYILLDEVTSSLDVEQIENLFRHLMFLLKSGIGIVVVTHLLGFARAVLKNAPGSDIVFLDEGRAVTTGGLELLESPPAGRIHQFVTRMKFASY